MNRMTFLISGMAIMLSATVSGCGAQTAKPQTAAAIPAAKPAKKPPRQPAAQPIPQPIPQPMQQPAKSRPIPKGGTKSGAQAGTKTATPPPQPGTITLERRTSIPGNAGSLLGKTEKMIRAQFGEPRLDVREGPGQKLQFSNEQCVADIYLFPPAPGKDAQVIHLDARDSAGRDVDRDGCIAALLRKR